LRELSLHLMDIVQNSIAAEAKHVKIIIDESSTIDVLELIVQDDGKGMDQQLVQKAMDPFFTTRNTRKVGLGIPLLKEAAEACNGGLTIKSDVGKGTELSVTFQRSHIDRMPMGDLPTTLFSLVISYPEIMFRLEYQVDDKRFVYDDEKIKNELKDIPLTEPSVLRFLREYIDEGIRKVMSIESEKSARIIAV
jgi:anti-sigma regulatory factor (Ser/Thr protein kinase)